MGTLLTHQGLSEMVPALQGLPRKFEQATNEDLKFGELPAALDKLLNQAEDAVQTCGKQPSQCRGGGVEVPLPAKDTTSQHEQILEATKDAQEIIDNIATDKILGSEAMRNQSASLVRIKQKADAINTKGS